MALQYAAHVDHPISHSSDLLSFGLSLGAAAIGVIVVVYSGGTALLAFAPAVEAIGTVATYGSVGMTGGKLLDQFLPPSASEGKIGSGNDTVLLGPSLKPAARAQSDDSKSKTCHINQMKEGSETVLIGILPMTRRGDRTKCGGKVSDGIDSIIVGGEPSAQGQEVSEEDSARVALLSNIWDLLSGVTTGLRHGPGLTNTEHVLNLARGAGQVTAVGVRLSGNSTAADILKAASTGRPTTRMDAMDAAKTEFDGVNAALGAVRGSPGGGQ